MTKDELYKTLANVYWAQLAAPSDRYVQIISGKIFYLMNCAALYIQNDVTAQLPDCAISWNNFEVLYRWLYIQNDVNVDWHVIADKSLTISCHESVLKLALMSQVELETDLYADFDEIVLKPLLVNKYVFTVDRTEFVRRLRSITLETEGTVKISISKPVVRLLTQAGYSSAKSTIITHEEVLPSSWETTYLLDPMLMNNSNSATVQVSFTDNTNKLLSPLILRYENGVTVVVSPIWN